MNRVLFLGEGPRGAGYLEGVLQSAFDVRRVYGADALADASDIRLEEFQLFVLSDYPSGRLAPEEQRALVRIVRELGHGLLMIGGWASFGGPRGSYQGSTLADLLPVAIAPTDDRRNTPLGTILIARAARHPAIESIQGQLPSVVVGYNDVRARPEAEVLIEGHHLSVDGQMPRLSRAEAPMLTVWQVGRGRVGALAPDMSPHWAGGIVDWGDRRVTLPSGSECGHLYRAFLLDLCHWLVG